MNNRLIISDICTEERDVVGLSSAETALDKPAAIKVMDGKVYINEAQVIITDIEASNGVIPVIDSLILPPK